MGKDGARGGSERAPVLQATSGDRRVLLQGIALDPREALVASLLQQVQGTPQEAALTRLLDPPEVDPSQVPTAESAAVVAHATRSAAGLGDLADLPAGPVAAGALPPPPPEPPIPAYLRDLDEDAPPTVRGSVWRFGFDFLVWRTRDALRRRRPQPPPPRSLPPTTPRPDPLAGIDALDRQGRRLDALDLARARAASERDPLLAEKIAEIASRLVRSPSVDLVWDGRPTRVIFGASAVLGRAGTDIPVSHPGISRRHLRISQEEGGALARDLGTLNGTYLGGERVSGPVAVGPGLALALAGTVPCRVFAFAEHALAVEVGGTLNLLVVSGALPLGPWRLERCGEGEGRRFVLAAGDVETVTRLFGEVASRIELCHGDAIGDGQRVRLRVE